MTISPSLAEHLIKSGLKLDETYYAAVIDDAALAYAPPLSYAPPLAYAPPPAFGAPPVFGPPSAYAQPTQYSPPLAFSGSDYGLPVTYSAPSLPGSAMTYSPPRVAKSNGRRILLIVGATLGVIGIAGGVAALNVQTTTTTPISSSGFNNPRKLENGITAALNQRLSDPTGRYYSKGVSVTDVLCVSKTAHTFTCNVEASDGRSETVEAVVTADGQRFVTK